MKLCRHCGKEFAQARPLQAVCSPRCSFAEVRVAKKAEKASIKVRREKLKTVTEHEADCRRIVQAIARLRDRNDGCISCHVGPEYAGQWHGSHYRPAGNNSAVQFHLWNIHKSCAQCNKFKGGNLGAYRPRLVEKIGLERVEWLESQNYPVKRGAWYVDYLKRFKVVMSRRLRRLESRRA